VLASLTCDNLLPKGFGDGFDGSDAPQQAIGTIVLPSSSSSDARVDALDQKVSLHPVHHPLLTHPFRSSFQADPCILIVSQLDMLIQHMVQNSPRLGDRSGSAALAATAPSRLSMNLERNGSSNSGRVGIAY
jgi:hypothetical protein